MSRKSSGLDNCSSSEDIELKEFSRSSEGYSDLGSNEDLTTSCEQSSKQSETGENEINDSAVTYLNICDENHHEFNTRLGSFSSLKGISLGDLTRNVKSSGLNRRTSSLEETSFRRASSLEPLKEPSTRRALSLDLIKGFSSRRVSSVDPLEGPPTNSFSSLDPFEQHSSRKVSLLDPLVGHTTRRVPDFDPLEGTSNKNVWSPDPSNDSLTNICEIPNSETETNEPSNNESPTNQNGCYFRMLIWLNSFLRRYTRQFRHSEYNLLLHLALFSIPLSAGYMGAKYYHLCDGCPKLPGLVNLLGILGMCLLTVRLASIVSKRYFSPFLTGRELDWCMILFVPFFMILLVEVSTIYICKPVFTPRLSTMNEFCYIDFYNYAYYMNVVVLAAMLLLLLIDIPGSYDPAEAE